MLRIAVLDDYQNVALAMADWSKLGDVKVDVYHDHLSDESAVAARLAGYQVVVIMRERTSFGRSLIDRLPDLKLLVTTGPRNSAVDLAACSKRGIVVCGTERGPAGTAEIAFGLIIDLMRRITAESRDLAAGRWQTGLGTVLEGKVLGLVGLGRVGTRMARMGNAFDMDVIAWSQNLTEERAREAGARAVSRGALFTTADVVSVHLVLGQRSAGVVGRREIGLMKPSSYLVNTARAGIVDHEALLHALETGAIAGAGLDVFPEEPLPLTDRLRSAPNVLLTPHLGYVALENYRVFYSQAVEDIIAWCAGEPVRLLAGH